MVVDSFPTPVNLTRPPNRKVQVMNCRWSLSLSEGSCQSGSLISSPPPKSCQHYMGIALLIALPVSTGSASTLDSQRLLSWPRSTNLTSCQHPLRSSSTRSMLASRRSARLMSTPALGVRMLIAQHTAMPTVTRKPRVGPTTLQWHGF